MQFIANKASALISEITDSYTVCGPISLNYYLDFSSMPPFLVFSFFMHMNMRNIPENHFIETP